MPKALITGITGQDGSYLAELLLAKGYEVVGMVRRTSHHSYERIEHLLDRIEIVAGRPARPALAHGRAAGDPARRGLQPRRPVLSCRPRWTQPVLTGEFTALGVTRMLEAIRLVAPRRPVLPGQLVGDVRQGAPRRRSARRTPFYPRSPYGVAKVYGHWITVNYRESLRHVRGERASCSTTSRPRRGHRVRHPQGHRRRGPHQARARRRAPAGQPRRPARLGLRRRLRRRDVADAAAATRRTTTWSAPARPTACASWSRSRSATSGSTSASTS